ncbi:hypothetical protein [Clostridium paraputrificum]|uniref:hypothetical protein n=1 Tax=Clostridium paraputrificum TaxID=29363 RepID=UPI0018AB7369|nr:hypothetical protein [Clostridium paraputrificum]MDB2100049.1 hypothetical protein [Clostridium paraputrificum]
MKVRCINAEGLTSLLVEGKIYEGDLLYDDVRKEKLWHIKSLEGWVFEDFIFEKVKELTFEEVIANIKDGEVWECTRKTARVKEIKKNGEVKNSLIVFNFGCLTEDTRASIQGTDTFKLKRKEYTFEEAFKALEEGKEIESLETYERLKLKDGRLVYFDSYDGQFYHADGIEYNEIKGKWYIND